VDKQYRHYRNKRRTNGTHSFTHSWPFHEHLSVTYSAGWHL
jgi:hypothetical protein